MKRAIPVFIQLPDIVETQQPIVDKEYILFVMEYANFMPRCALIPKAEFVQARGPELDLIHKLSIDGVLTQEIIWSGRMGETEKYLWSDIVHTIFTYIEGYDESEEDRPWVDLMITEFSRVSFDVFDTVKYITENFGTKCKIVDRIVVVERHVRQESNSYGD